MNSRGGAMSSNLPNSAEKSTNPTVAPNSGSSFAFRKRWCQIDWRLLALVDVDRIAKEMDFQSLQQNIMNVTFCNIDTEEFQHVDRNFIKIFKLSQLVIEYLLHSQQYLSNQANSLEQKVICVQQELDKAIYDLKLHEEELKTVKKENRKRRKIIEAYQDMINAGATGLHACPVCKREFVSGEYLQSHIQRRHPGYMTNGIVTKQQKVTQEDLESKLMEQMTKRLLSSETQLREEMKQKEQETLQLQVKDFEDWKGEEKRKMTIEMEEFKRPVITELEEIRQEKRHLEKILQEKEELLSAQVRRQSHLGHLEGAQELIINEANKLNESKAEIQHLKEALETQMREMQAALKEQERSWQKKLSTSCKDKLTDSIAKLETLEHTIHDGSRTDRRNDKVSKKLKSLKQKMKQQEDLLLSQQDQLTSLQSREPSPIQLDNPDGSSDLDSDSEGDYDFTDFHEGKRFSPMIHRPMIKTKYPHTPEDTEKIKRQTHAIFSDMLVQNGLQRESNGLKNKDFEEKMAMLQQERQQKIQTHYHFAEHRQRLVKAVEEIITSDYKSVPSHKLQIPSPRQKSRNSSGLSTNTMGKPPKPTQKVTSSPTESTNIQLELDNKVPVDSNESDISITSSSEEISTKDKKDIPTVIITHGVNKPTPHGSLEMAHEQSTITKENNSWDSDDSIEELDPPHNGRTSSTPIKVLNATATKEAVDQHLDNISVDSFDLSCSELLAKSQPTKVAPPATSGFKPQSGTVTSQSAFTSVSMEDFDSDSSDLDISDLT